MSMPPRQQASVAALAAVAALLLSCCRSASAPQTPPPPAPFEPAALRSPALFVAPGGKDSWSGRLAEPDAGGTDGPLATPEGARDALRRMRAAGTLAGGPVTVYLREGRYRLTRSLALGGEDSGTPDGEVSFESYPGERAVLSGGLVVDDFGPLVDAEARGRLDRSARAHVLQADTRGLGLSDFGSVSPAGGDRIELYFRGELMSLARYPNDGWLTIASVPQTGTMVNPGLDRDTSAIPRGRHFGRFTYSGDRPARWKPGADIWVHGYWTWDWSDQYLRVDRIDTAKRELWPAPPHHAYGYTKGQRFAFLNVLEELDAPGEWYLDKARGLLFFWPPERPGPGETVIPVVRDPLVAIEGASRIAFRDLTFEAGRGSAVRLRGCSDCSIEGCLILDVGRTAVVVEGGEGCTVASCEIRDVGGGGISLSGGDRTTLTPARHAARGNHIHDFAQRLRTYQPAVAVAGVGQVVAGNLIHDAPHMAVSIAGNDHLLEYNEVHHIAQETGDVGAFYMGRDWTERGTVIRANYFHDLLGPGLYGVMAVYLDDAASGATVNRNLFVRAGRGVLIGGGRDNTVEHNVFVDCMPAISVDARGLGWARQYALPGGGWRMQEKLAAVPTAAEPWASRYPALARIAEVQDPAAPAGNVVRANISVGGRWIEVDAAMPPGGLTVEGNFTGADPGFVDPARGDYRLRDGSPALAAGFPQIEMDRMGLAGKPAGRSTSP